MKNPLILIFAFVGLVATVVLCAGILVVGTIVWAKRSAPPVVTENVPILVAAVDLPAGTILSDPETQLRLLPYLPDAVPPGALTSIEDLRGKVLARTIDVNTPVTTRDLGASQEIFRPVPEGKRAVTIRVKIEKTASGLLLPGSYIDLIHTAVDENDPARMGSKTILEKVMVLAINTRHIEPTNPADAEKSDTHSITVAVAPEEAEILAKAQQTGSLAPVLRRPEK